MPGRFADSNVVLYLASSDIRKLAISNALLSAGLSISVQVLNEATNVLRRKYKMSWQDVRDFLALVRVFANVVPIDLDTHLLALNIAERYGFTIYDSMILAAAMQSGCDTLFSEDMQHGQMIDGRVTVINPFI